MISLSQAAWRYPGGTAVGPVDLEVRAGELVLLTGPTGCGKSTVLRLAAGLLQRHGHGAFTGTVRIYGHDPAALVAGARVTTLGFVGQEPDDAVVSATVAAEVAFGPESAGFSPDRIAARVEAVLAQVGLAAFADRSPSALSGGQRQRLVIGAALAAGARALLLDEPLSQLDPAGAREVMRLLRALADEGVAVLCVEHRLELAMPVATRAVLMDAGRVVADPLVSSSALRALGLHGPALDELRELTGAERWRVSSPPPSGGGGLNAARRPRTDTGATPGEALRLDAVSFAWPGFPRCLHDVTLRIQVGERVAIVGANGAGKSTLLGVLAGHLRAQGKITSARSIDVPQNPDLGLFCETVAEELAYGPQEAQLPRADVDTRVASAAAALSVSDLLPRPPQALSRGQRLRTAVAAALTCAPRVLLLDEPTSGQDRDQVDRLFAALAGLDGALVFASHDLDVVLRFATRVIVLDAGRVVGDGLPLATLRASSLPLPPLAALCAELGLPYAEPATLATWLEPA